MIACNAFVGGDTRLFVIIGDPIAQARSPAVFNDLFQKWGLNAVLVPVQVPAADLDAAIAGLKAIRNLDGIVVTVPHKVALAAHVERLLPIAQRVGAVNCMRRAPDGAWEGDMHDGAGFVAGLQRQGLPPAGLRVFQAGCGGAGKAVAHALCGAGVRELRLVDLDAARQSALLQDLRTCYPDVALAGGDFEPAGVDLAVNATPCGMAPGDPLPFSVEALDGAAIVADLIMKPEMTPLLLRAQARGHRIHLGRHLLESQAEIIARFFGLAPAVEGGHGR